MMASLPDVRAGDNGVSDCRAQDRLYTRDCQGGTMHPTFERALEAPLQANVLVAFADCSRYLQSTRGLSSAELFSALNDFYVLTEDAVVAAGGLVAKFMGDAALVLFPEELADQGVMALLDLKASVDRWLQ